MNPSARLKYKLSIFSEQTGNGKLFIGKRSPFFGLNLALWSFWYAFIIYILLTPTSCWESDSSHAGCYYEHRGNYGDRLFQIQIEIYWQKVEWYTLRQWQA